MGQAHVALNGEMGLRCSASSFELNNRNDVDKVTSWNCAELMEGWKNVKEMLEMERAYEIMNVVE